MPYYRIVIWTKKRYRPYVGIRVYESYAVDMVYQMVYKKAESLYNSNLIGVEVQMLPKMCKAVQDHVRKQKK